MESEVAVGGERFDERDQTTLEARRRGGDPAGHLSRFMQVFTGLVAETNPNH